MPEGKITPGAGQVVHGVVVNETQFLGALPTAQLFQIVVDPRRTEDPREAAGDPALAAVREVRKEVQRMFEGAKKKNVPDYAEYIVQLHHGQPGLTPTMILWSKTALLYERNGGAGMLEIPYDAQLVALDGETQLAARFEAAKIDPLTKGSLVPVMFCHGQSPQWARQAFHDVNMLGVRPNAALAIGMDARDPLTAVAREIENGIPFFRGRVNAASRQLSKSDKDVVTIAALRAACVTVAEGISGIRHGAKPVYLKDGEVNAVQEAAMVWFRCITNPNHLGPAIEDRENKVAGAPPILAALGAMGHQLVGISHEDRELRMKELMRSLLTVNWEKGAHWSGITGKMNAVARFSVGGTKEFGYPAYSALSDSTDPRYHAIRKQNQS